MVKNIERIISNKRLTSAVLGVTPDEFQTLLPDFSAGLFEDREERYLELDRKRKPGGGKKGVLRTDAEKLFFILFYHKVYPTYDVLSLFYDCARSVPFKRQKQLSEILEKVLGKKLVLPKRQIRSTDEFFQAFPEAKEVFADGTERPIQRPKDKEKQKQNYSGKKKRHTRKNLVLTDKKKRVGFLSKTIEGKKHDFAILKEDVPPDVLPKDILKYLDLGFLGFEKEYPGSSVSMPKKKPIRKELTEEEKEANKKISSVRVLVENALAGVKRLRIVSDVFRGRKKDFDDQVMLISCGLWNYHLSMR